MLACSFLGKFVGPALDALQLNISVFICRNYISI